MSFELRDKTQLPLRAQRVMESERSAQLAHTQMPLQSSGVLGKSEALLPSLPQWNRFTQTVNELKSGGGSNVSQKVSLLHLQRRRPLTSPARAAQGPAGGGIILGRWCSTAFLQTSQKTAPSVLKVRLRGTQGEEEIGNQYEIQGVTDVFLIRVLPSRLSSGQPRSLSLCNSSSRAKYGPLSEWDSLPSSSLILSSTNLTTSATVWWTEPSEQLQTHIHTNQREPSLNPDVFRSLINYF